MDRRKAIVRDAYDAVAESWGRARRSAAPDPREHEWLERFFSFLPDKARVLDLGCGSGAPILTKLLDRGYRVTGVDLSHGQLVEAHQRCRAANLLRGDMAEVEFASASFDGVIAYDAIWHVPRAEHPQVFNGIGRWLVPGGVALLTVAAARKPGGPGLFTELMGAPVFYDAWPATESFQMLSDAGLAVVAHHLPLVDGPLIVLVKK
jgi:cyclopropane fatty-acyl-phospholipid synthase-like methyltransferase